MDILQRAGGEVPWADLDCGRPLWQRRALHGKPSGGTPDAPDTPRLARAAGRRRDVASGAGRRGVAPGLLHTLSPAPFYIAQERGYFRDEGIDLTFRFFEAAQPIAAAAVSGDIDVGVTALTGGFFNLAEKGTLKVIGGGLHEEHGYQGSAVLVSNKAYDAGLTALDKLAGHSFAITQYGSSFHYMIGRIAEAEGFDLKSVTLRPVQQVPNMLAAVRSGQVDATIAIASQAKPLAANGQAHIIGWVGDIVPYQITARVHHRADDRHSRPTCCVASRGPIRRAWPIIARRSCGGMRRASRSTTPRPTRRSR